MFSFSAIVSAARRHRIRHAAIRDLRQLSSEQLDDLGLTPERIDEVVDGMLAQAERRRTGHRGKAIAPVFAGAASSLR